MRIDAPAPFLRPLALDGANTVPAPTQADLVVAHGALDRLAGRPPRTPSDAVWRQLVKRVWIRGER